MRVESCGRMDEVNEVEAPQLPPSPGGYDVDIPCVECKYNLRGLRLDGVCPECACPTKISVEAMKLRLRSAYEPLTVASWVDGLAEGALFTSIGFVLILFVAVAPSGMYRLRSSERVVMLGIACCISVLCWCGAWKLTSPDPAGREQRFGVVLRVLCRMSATLFFASPFLAALIEPFQLLGIWETILFAPLFIFSVVAALTAGPGYYLHLRSLPKRMRSAHLSHLAVVLSVTNFFAFTSSILPGFGHDESSLAQVMRLPTCAFGSPETARELLMFAQSGWNSPSRVVESMFYITGFLAFVAAGLFHLLLWIQLRRTARAIRDVRTKHVQTIEGDSPNSPP